MNNFSAPQTLINGHVEYYKSPELVFGEHSVTIEKAEPYNDGFIMFDQVDMHGELKPYKPILTTILNIEPGKNQIHLNEEVPANITIDNIREIAAEDVRIKYDNTKLKFLSMDEVDGIKLVKSEDKDGEFTLLDLAIDARHLGEDPTTLAQYNTDIEVNNAIDNNDLLKIGEYMLANLNYSPNN